MKVDIGSSSWEVVFEPDLSHGDQDVYGLTMFKQKTIKITKGQQPYQELHTFFHEFLHAAIHEYSLAGVLDQKEEEDFVDLLSLALVQSAKSSKQFRDYLKEKLK
jgi:hypothetical protein